MTTTLVPASIIGKVFFVMAYNASGSEERIYFNEYDYVPLDKDYYLGRKRKRLRMMTYVECRILAYRPETGEIKLRLDTVSNNCKLYHLWREANQDWVKELTIKYIFIE